MTVTVRSPAALACEIALLALALTACSGGRTKAQSVAAHQGSPTANANPTTAADTQQGSPAAGANPPVAAVGAKTFCDDVINGLFAFGANSNSDTTDKESLVAARAQAHEALRLAPSELKSDVGLLVATSDAFYDRLAAVDFDTSKLTAADMAGFAVQPVAAAQKNLAAYMTKTCRASADSGPAQSDSAASTDTATSSAAGACGLATIQEISAATGKVMAIAGDAGNICVFHDTKDDSFTVSASVYPDDASKALMKELQGAGSEDLKGLGDTAFWNAATGTVYVGKGDRGFSFTLPSFDNLSSTPAAVKSKFVKLATQTAARF